MLCDDLMESKEGQLKMNQVWSIQPCKCYLKDILIRWYDWTTKSAKEYNLPDMGHCLLSLRTRFLGWCHIILDGNRSRWNQVFFHLLVLLTENLGLNCAFLEPCRKSGEFPRKYHTKEILHKIFSFISVLHNWEGIVRQVSPHLTSTIIFII